MDPAWLSALAEWLTLRTSRARSLLRFRIAAAFLRVFHEPSLFLFQESRVIYGFKDLPA